MNTLHVRSIPEELYRKLIEIARMRNRSLSAQVVEMLMQSVKDEELRTRQVEVLEGIRRRRFSPPASAASTTDLLREDRNR
jgi:hypothetical protein